MASPSGSKTGLILITAIGFGIAAAFMSILYLKSRESAIKAAYEEEEEQMIAVVVAKTDLNKGQQISSAEFAVLKLPAKYVHSNAVPVSAFNNYVGRYLIEDMTAGNSLLTSFVDESFPVDFSDLIEKGRRAMTIQVDTDASTAGMMRPGNRLDIYVNVGARVVGYKNETASADAASGGDLRNAALQLVNNVSASAGDVILPVLQDALVLATGKDAYAEHLDALGQPQRRSTTNYNSITLDVTPEQAALLALAQDKGDLIGVLRNRDDRGDATFTGITPLDLFSNATAMKKAAALKKAAEAAGATIDENGNWVTADGKVISKENIVVSANGTVSTKGGELLAGADGAATSKDEMMKAAGYTINEDGDYVDANGNVVKKDDVKILANGTVMTTDGKVISGQNVTVNEDGFIIAADGTVMTADGKILTGVTVNENGEVVDANGNILRDANLTVADDGTVTDSNGNVLTGVSGGGVADPELQIPGIIALTAGGSSEDGVAKTSVLPVEPVAGGGGSPLDLLKQATATGEAQ